MSLLAGCLGMKTGASAICIGFLIGGIFSLAKLLYRRELIQRFTYFLNYVNRIAHTHQIFPYYLPDRDGYGITIPLTACIFAGMCTALILRY